ncbi:hypothetical protein QOT17_017097 [Balamuthia mandrillaris]
MEYVWQIIGTREGTGAFPEGQQPQQRELRKSLKSISWPLFSPLAASPHSSAQEMDGQQPWVAVEEGFLREWEAKTVLSAKQRDIAHRLLLQHAEFCPDDVETFQREGLPQAPPALVTNAAAPSSTDEHIREERDEASVAAYSEESGGRGGGEENDTEEAMQRIYAWLDAIAEAGETEKAADFGLKVADIVDNRNWCKQLEDEIEEVLRFIATKRKECGSITDPQTAEQLKQACEQQFFAYNSDEFFASFWAQRRERELQEAERRERELLLKEAQERQAKQEELDPMERRRARASSREDVFSEEQRPDSGRPNVQSELGETDFEPRQHRESSLWSEGDTQEGEKCMLM